MTDAATFLICAGIVLLAFAILAAVADTFGAWLDRREARRDWRSDHDERRRQARERAWRQITLLDPPYDHTHDNTGGSA